MESSWALTDDMQWILYSFIIKTTLDKVRLRQTDVKQILIEILCFWSSGPLRQNARLQ